ncbi:caspase, EACC1-associated type [Streptomyces sp. S6]
MNGLPDPATSRAVLIGVSTYHHLPGLPSVANNVTALAELLTDPDLWGLPKKHCVVLSDPGNPVRVLDRVQAATAQAGDAFLLYFAGHGLLSPGSDAALHLALPASHAERLHSAVEFSRLRHMLTACKARSKVVVLDCCYSARAMEGHLAAPVEFADQTGVDGTYVMTACGETKTALAPPGEEHTAFTGELIRTLREGIPAGPDPLDMEAVFSQVRRELIAKGRPEPQQRARNAGHRIALVRNRWTGARTPEALAYGTALRDLFQRAGARRNGRADAPDPMLNRYLQGESVAPAAFLTDLARSLAERGHPLPQPDLDRLHDLRRKAQAVDPDPAVQLLHSQEEFRRLRSDWEQAEREHTARTARRLAELEEQLTGLGQQLADAVTRTETVERERDEIRATANLQRVRLEHARDYTRQVETDLTAYKEEARLLHGEVAVLRKQVRQLLDEPSPRPADRATVRIAAKNAVDAHGAARSRAAEETAASGPRAVWIPAEHRPTISPAGRVRCGSVLVISSVPPVSALAAATGFVEGMQAHPGPAVWKLVLYAVVTLIGVAVVSVMALVVCVGVLEECDPCVWDPDCQSCRATANDLKGSHSARGAASLLTGMAITFGGTVLALILGPLGAALEESGYDLLGHRFADWVGLL